MIDSPTMEPDESGVTIIFRLLALLVSIVVNLVSSISKRIKSSSKDQITLSNLPVDIIRTIVRMEGETMENLRPISKSWNHHIRELLYDRNDPLILHEVIMVRSRLTGEIKANVNVRQEFAPRIAKILPDWKQIGPYTECKENYVCFEQEILHFDGNALPEPDLSSRKDATFWGNKISVAENFDPNSSRAKAIATFNEMSATQEEDKLAKIKATLRNLRQLFLACSYVEYLNMRFFTTSNLEGISRTFHKVPVKELVFMFVLMDEEKRAALLKIVRSTNTAQCFIHAGYYTRRNLGDFLLNISKHVSMLELHQCSADIDVYGYPSSEDHPLYGIPSHFWHVISRQMLGNGLHRFKFSDGKDCLIERSRPDESLPKDKVKVRLDNSF